MLREVRRMLSIERRFLFRWAVFPLTAQLVGAAIAIRSGFIWYTYIALCLPFLFMGGLFAWYAIKGHMLPVQYTIAKVLQIGALSGTADARYIRKTYCMWFLIGVNMLFWAIVAVSAAIAISIGK